MDKIYAAIDLKSFYASVECIERGLDPITTNLVVADPSRTEKTICLAVTPALKSYGISGRARLFEVVQRVREVNAERRRNAPGRTFTGSSTDMTCLQSSPELSLDYIVAPPQMAHYMRCSTRIYNIYLKYVAPEDIHVYSIDEVFIDLTSYLNTGKITARQFVMKMLLDVLDTTGITASAGMGTNLYLAKVAMDIGAKHISPDKNGVRIAQLDEMSYRHSLWTHRPIRDFWRIGSGYAKKLEAHGIYTMGDVARCSIQNEDLLYKMFGVNAELLIDHAWGWEPCTIADIKAYKSTTNSISSGQVLQNPYTFAKARVVVREMTDLLVLDLVEKGLVTDQMVLTVGYDIENLQNDQGRKNYTGAVTIDQYGRAVPKHAHGTVNLSKPTSSTKQILEAVSGLYDRIVNKDLLIRRINVTANRVVSETSVLSDTTALQLDMFTDYEALQAKQSAEAKELEREKEQQKAILEIKKKFGKNAIIKGMNLEEGATAMNRNNQIGGHKA